MTYFSRLKPVLRSRGWQFVCLLSDQLTSSAQVELRAGVRAAGGKSHALVVPRQQQFQVCRDSPGRDLAAGGSSEAAEARKVLLSIC